MNLKYYLRGLGIGIVVSTIIVGIAANNRTQTLSDTEIRQRAAELGMVEPSGVLADEIPSAESLKEKEELPSPTPEAEDEETPVPTEAPEKEEVASPSPEDKDNQNEVKEEEPTPTATPEAKEEEPAPTEAPEVKEEESSSVAAPGQEEALAGETVTIVVRSGDGSYSVCKKLEEAGLIESATAYDTYLYEKGYDKRIVAASHEIPADADEEQIAKILTGKN